MTPALTVRNLGKTFGGERRLIGGRKAAVQALQEVSFLVTSGETLGIVGESGCGKSTLARMLVGLLPPSSGSVEIEGKDLSQQAGDPAAFGRLIQYVFQDPLSSLNPRKTIRQILEAPLKHLLDLKAPDRASRIAALFGAVNLRAEFLERYPHEFSGGQAQRIGIARALAAEPRILVLDEPVSALDVSVQAQVLNLLAELRQAYDLTYLFISHDLAVVEAISDRVAVLYFGRIVELGPAARIFSRPSHPYTQLLADSAPQVGRPLKGEERAAELPDPLNPPQGCAFAARCRYTEPTCRTSVPELTEVSQDHAVACYHPLR